MKYSVTFYDNGLTKTLYHEWDVMPKDGVLWVDIVVGGHEHELVGGDSYWIHGNMYGMTFEWAQPIFGGALYATWQVVDGEFEYLGEVPPPDGAYLIYGVGLPDDEWEELRNGN